MAAEAGHATNRAYFDRSGNIHLNGAKLYDASEVDQAPSLGGSGSTAIGVAGGYAIARGQTTTGSASDTVVTGLTTVVSAVANLDDAPIVACEIATASIGDQAGTPAAGSILIQTWKTIGGTPAAATTFTKKVNWIAIGTI